MKHPEDPSLWQSHNDRAANRLPANLADTVLRRARLEKDATSKRSGFFPFALSTGTAIACLLGFITIHGEWTKNSNARHLAEWQQLAADLDTLNDL